MSEPDEEWEARAQHEAGHALVAMLRGGRVLSCALDSEDEPGEGRTEVEWPPAADAWTRIEARCATALAGPVAEMLARGEDLPPGPPESWPEAWAADWAEAWEAAGRHRPDTAARWSFLAEVLRGLVRLLSAEEHRRTLERLVDHLLAEEFLDEDEVRDLVDGWS